MQILLPYTGKFISAKSASTKLDVDAIIDGCNAVASEISSITSIATKIEREGNTMDSKALSVDDVTVEKSLANCCDEVRNVKSNILDTTEKIKEAAVSIYNSLQEQLNAEAIQKDQLAIDEYNKRNSNE